MAESLIDGLLAGDAKALARSITLVENGDARALELLKAAYPAGKDVPIIGITGPAGVGKSSLVDQLIALYRAQNFKVGVVAAWIEVHVVTAECEAKFAGFIAAPEYSHTSLIGCLVENQTVARFRDPTAVISSYKKRRRSRRCPCA